MRRSFILVPNMVLFGFVLFFLFGFVLSFLCSLCLSFQTLLNSFSIRIGICGKLFCEKNLRMKVMIICVLKCKLMQANLYNVAGKCI